MKAKKIFWMVMLALVALIGCLTAESVGGQYVITPTNVTVQDGAWEDSATWSQGVPGPTDDVRVEHDVLLSNDQTVQDIDVYGSVLHRGGTLFVRTLHVSMGGQYAIEEQGRIVIRDVPIADESGDQLGNGILNMGTFTTNGIDKTDWTRATDAIRERADTIVVQDATGWAIGDQIVIGDTRQRVMQDSHRWRATDWNHDHYAKVTDITERTITFEPPTTYEHPGISPNSRDIERFAPVGNLTRSIEICSENPDGVRGHTMSMNNAVWRVKNTRFASLGRTDPGEVIRPETNWPGRYCMHGHRAWTKESVLHIEGCAVWDYGKWGISLHECNDDYVVGNVWANGVGAAIVCERGNELRNTISENCIIGLRGGYQVQKLRGGIERFKNAELTTEETEILEEWVDSSNDVAADGSGIWLRNNGQMVVGNVICGSPGYAINVNGYYDNWSKPYLLDPDDRRRSGDIPFPLTGGTSSTYEDNEFINCYGGWWFTYDGGTIKNINQLAERGYRITVSGTVSWNLARTHWASWHTGFITASDEISIQDPTISAMNGGSRNRVDKEVGVGIRFGGYENLEMEFVDCTFEGWNVGYKANRKGNVMLDGCAFDCFAGKVEAGRRDSLDNLTETECRWSLNSQLAPRVYPSFDSGPAPATTPRPGPIESIFFEWYQMPTKSRRDRDGADMRELHSDRRLGLMANETIFLSRVDPFSP